MTLHFGHQPMALPFGGNHTTLQTPRQQHNRRFRVLSAWAWRSVLLETFWGHALYVYDCAFVIQRFPERLSALSQWM